MATVQSGYGRILLFDDFCGPEIPIAGAEAYGATSPWAAYIGPFKCTGDFAETDTGVVSTSKSNGFVLISGNNEDGKGVAVGTEIVFSPILNGPMAIECRLERAAVTAGVIFVGFCDVNADDVAEPCTSTTTTITSVASDYAGWLLDSQLDATAEWHMPYVKASATATQTSTDVDSGITAVAAECNVLRVECDSNGDVRWLIDGVLKQTVASCLTTTTLMAAYVGCWGTTSTAASADVDYLAVEANRDWTK